MDQLGFRNLDEHQHDVAAFIIGSLDDDGYLRRDIDNIVDDLAFRMNITTTREEVLDMLHIIQQFDPPGIGARDLRECLLIQLRGLRQTPDVINAEKIITDWFQDESYPGRDEGGHGKDRQAQSFPWRANRRFI